MDAYDARSDWARLARYLAGRSIGLVLGGGGARGIAHIGLIKALHDAGVPIDFVGGTSIGSFVGALYSLYGRRSPREKSDSFERFFRLARQWSLDEMGSFWKMALDLTFPLVSYMRGVSLSRAICTNKYSASFLQCTPLTQAARSIGR